MMTLTEFKNSLANDAPPQHLSVYLQALWYDAKGEWKIAHHLVDSLPGNEAAAVHAYLHRVEGDNGNAKYWYAKAGKRMKEISLQDEWKELAEELLAEA